MPNVFLASRENRIELYKLSHDEGIIFLDHYEKVDAGFKGIVINPVYFRNVFLVDL
jgi:hypothetical protein